MYVTYYVKQTPTMQQTQLTFDQLFNENGELKEIPETAEYFATKGIAKFKTINVTKLSPEFQAQIDRCYESYKHNVEPTLAVFAQEDMHSHYTEFQIPKHSGGMRTINAPDDQLKSTLNTLKTSFESYGILPHTAAYAYVRNRTAKDAVVRHQKTGHEWFLKMDLHDFFGSCSKKLIISSLCQIPFFAKFTKENWEILLHAIMLNDGLPQGTPISPWLTNQVMLPYDFLIANACRQHNMTYTRYADDMLISALNKDTLKYGKEIVTAALAGTGLTLNDKKTKISSIYGQNWMLGLMLNKEKKVTIGWKKKERFRATLFNFLSNPNQFNTQTCMELLGLMNYYTQIEPEYFNAIIDKYNAKFQSNVKSLLISKIKGDIIGE